MVALESQLAVQLFLNHRRRRGTASVRQPQDHHRQKGNDEVIHIPHVEAYRRDGPYRLYCLRGARATGNANNSLGSGA